jgi:ubiquinone/menaquinone biosynthesis C-methylase UbiE
VADRDWQSEDEVAAVYDAAADLYADLFPTTEPEQPVDLAMVAHFIARLPANSSVLDAGCGAGRMLPVLAASGSHPIGVDVSPQMIRRARQDHPEFETQVASLTALPFPDASFDAVFSWYSTIHLPDDRLVTALSEIHRVLRPAGRILVAFQTGQGTRDVAHGMRRHGLDVVLLRHQRSPDHLAAILTDQGFQETTRLVREPLSRESDGQAILIAQRPGAQTDRTR